MRAIGDVIVELDAKSTALDVRHVFGGALALAYYAEPRGTVDVDINLDDPNGSRTTLLAQRDTIGWHADDNAARAVRAAGTRLHQTGETVVTYLSFAFDDFHEVVLDGAVARPFIRAGERQELQFLSAEDLTVFKISFGRPEDWVDIESMIDAGTTIDPDYVENQSVRFRGPTAYPSAARLRALLRGQILRRGASPRPDQFTRVRASSGSHVEGAVDLGCSGSRADDRRTLPGRCCRSDQLLSPDCLPPTTRTGQLRDLSHHSPEWTDQGVTRVRPRALLGGWSALQLADHVASPGRAPAAAISRHEPTSQLRSERCSC